MAQKNKIGHRQRLRERFLRADDSSYSEIALLELLLTFSIPQKDVEPLARHLINKFGSLSAVLDASLETLCQVEGIKSNSAALLKLVDWIRSNHVVKPGKSKAMKQYQTNLFENSPAPELEKSVSTKQKPVREKVSPRHGSEMFTNAVLKEAVALLPGAPDTESLEVIRAYLRETLHYSAEQTRQRYASYITRRMFPEGYADAPFRLFAKTYLNSQAFRDVCFYRFLKSEPLELQVIEELLLPTLGNGRLGRDQIRKYLSEKYPVKKSILGCAQAVVDALGAAYVAKVERTIIIFQVRDIPIPAFAFVLYSEFPEPGMYDIRKIEESRIMRAMLWNPERLLPSLYELRNMGLISKISEIDNVRQFTTKHTLAGVVEQIVSGGKKA